MYTRDVARSSAPDRTDSAPPRAADPIPPEQPPRSESRPSSLTERGALERALAKRGRPRVAVELWDGHVVQAGGEEPVGRIRVADRRTLWRLAWSGDWAFGEAFAEGRLTVEGDLVDTLTEFSRAMVGDRRWRRWSGSWWKRRRRRRNTRRQSRNFVHHHYDIGNDFYGLWLDENLVYTCAYFPTREATLEAAQVAKMDLVCGKLDLKPGETVVEAGCGWGGLALHMAERYGVNVRAYNVSHQQILCARERAARAGLDHRVEFVEDDWRNATGPCDAFVSVGMLEHVGVRNYAELGRVIDRCLAPEGRGLIHTIGIDWVRPLQVWIERRIFPGAQPPTLAEMMTIFQTAGTTVLDVENLRRHYALTLRHWLDRYRNAVDEVRATFDEKFARMWEFYLAGSVAAFETGGLQLFQVVFNRTGGNAIPWTRDEWVRPQAIAATEFQTQPPAKG